MPLIRLTLLGDIKQQLKTQSNQTMTHTIHTQTHKEMGDIPANTSHIVIPNEYMSVLTLYFWNFNDSGLIHLMGPECESVNTHNSNQKKYNAQKIKQSKNKMKQKSNLKYIKFEQIAPFVYK